MLDHAPSPANTPTDPVLDESAEELCMLRDMARFGMNLLKAMDDQVAEQRASDQAAPGLVPLFDATRYYLPFERISRAVRLALVLKRRFAAGDTPGLTRPERAAAPAPAAPAPAALAPWAPPSPAPRDTSPAGVQLHEMLDDVIGLMREGRPQQETFRLYEKFSEWHAARGGDRLDAMSDRAIFCEICDHLGLKVDLGRFEHRAWVTAEAPTPIDPPDAADAAPSDAPPDARRDVPRAAASPPPTWSVPTTPPPRPAVAAPPRREPP
jgi:hypothetical protein